ncbi:hypothetical protein BS78_03G118800 [Paspalum vaginatum]|uniref:Uncharacterized protein n=1 Tax=Paspalum vaginatum TaxID=158149 RepID=A0A9W7XAG1_9POAL|nr:hypothetical protein BS78_K297400 [Paspalum vaginatum]KAJ1283312.1 hypothetical protein BS78_03G118800 [Paspalum vaginatum]
MEKANLRACHGVREPQVTNRNSQANFGAPSYHKGAGVQGWYALAAQLQVTRSSRSHPFS